MHVKLPLLAICLSISVHLTAQMYDLPDLGKFKLIEILQFPESITPGPGQYAKFSPSLIAGCEFDDGDTSYSALYLIPIGNQAEAKRAIEKIDIESIEGYRQYLQGSASADGKTLVFTVNDYSGWIGNDLAMCVMDDNGQYGAPQLLTALNSADMSEAYPFLSADGHRLYFLKDEKLQISTRSKTSDSFSSFQAVSFVGTVDLPILSVYLDASEKTLWLINNNIVYTAHRKNKKKAFSLPVPYTDEFNSLEFISSLSFSADGKDMYLYISDEQDEIVHFRLK